MAVLPKTKQRKWNRKPKRKDSPHKSFYQSDPWKKYSDKLLTEYGTERVEYKKGKEKIIKLRPICDWKGKRAKCQKIARTVDHDKGLTDGGKYFPPREECNFLCRSCHQAKTNMEKANRRLKVKKTITPRGLT